MKVSGRALELNAIFLVAVLLLVSLQVFLHHVQKRMYTEEVRNLSERAVPVPSAEEQDADLGAALGVLEEAAPSQPAFVPNIRKSFPKRKAHYFRKLKKSKKNKKNKKNKAAPPGPKKDAPHARGKSKAMGAKKEAKLMHDDIVRLKKAVQREMSEGRRAEKAIAAAP